MFGLNDDTQKSNDDPAMLDNVKDLASQPASAVEPQQPQFSTPSNNSATDSASSSTNGAVGFNMPDDTSTTTPPVEPTAETSQVPVSSESDNPGHIEPVEGFSSTPLPVSEEPSLADGTASLPPASSDTNADNTTASDLPQISQHSSPAIGSAPSEPAQNDVSAPPAPTESGSSVSANAENATDEPQASTAKTPVINHDELAAIKKEALGHLEGLTDHIEGSPEEVFRNTMQLIQANDNHTLLQKALDAAKNIEDDKLRAQAMLDIVNETNYFSQDTSDN